MDSPLVINNFLEIIKKRRLQATILTFCWSPREMTEVQSGAWVGTKRCPGRSATTGQCGSIRMASAFCFPQEVSGLWDQTGKKQEDGSPESPQHRRRVSLVLVGSGVMESLVGKGPLS